MKNIILLAGLSLISFVKAELEVSWDDQNSPNLVKLANPSQEEEFNGERISVALANFDALSLTCKVDFASKQDIIKFTSQRSSGSPLQLDETKEKHEEVGGLHYLRKEARIEQVQADMDDSTIKCDYNRGKAVKATLSVWKMTMTARCKGCDLEITFSEKGDKDIEETNVIETIKAKVNKIVRKSVNFNHAKKGFITKITFDEAKKNSVLRNIEDKITVDQQIMSGVEFFGDETPAPGSESTNIWTIVGIVVGLIIGGVGGGVIFLIVKWLYKDIHCTITGHGSVRQEKKTTYTGGRTGANNTPTATADTIPEKMIVNFYAEVGRRLDEDKAKAMLESLSKDNKKQYSDKPDPILPDHYIEDRFEMEKVWLSLPKEGEDWIAGVYSHDGLRKNRDVEAVNKSPDLIDMHNDKEIQQKYKDKELDLDYMLQRINAEIRSTTHSKGNIIVHVLI